MMSTVCSTASNPTPPRVRCLPSSRPSSPPVGVSKIATTSPSARRNSTPLPCFPLPIIPGFTSIIPLLVLNLHPRRLLTSCMHMYITRVFFVRRIQCHGHPNENLVTVRRYRLLRCSLRCQRTSHGHTHHGFRINVKMQSLADLVSRGKSHRTRSTSSQKASHFGLAEAIVSSAGGTSPKERRRRPFTTSG